MELYQEKQIRGIYYSFIYPWWDQFWTHQDVKNLKNSVKSCKDSSGSADDLQGEGWGAELVCPARGDTGMVQEQPASV